MTENSRAIEKPIVEPDVIILGCVSTKRSTPSKAKDLYDSPMFARRRRYAESSGKPWVIFSAKHGIIDPDYVIEPYDVGMSTLPVVELRAKGRQAVDQLETLTGSLRGKVFEIHAGASYVKAIAAPLESRGGTLQNRLERLQFGRQLQWYDRQAGVAKPQKVRPASSVAPAAAALLPARSESISGDIDIDEVLELEPFDFRWPEGIEQFDHGWNYKASIGGTSFRVRHGIGGREVYGKFRVHSVTWLDAQPMVEGVAPDDYAASGALLSTLRIKAKAHVRELTDLPMGYAGFTVVRQSAEIAAKYSRRSLAVKILEDDLAAWARHAVLRARSKGPGSVGRAYRKVAQSVSSPPANLPMPPDLDQAAVVRALLDFATKAQAELNKDDVPFFTPNVLANQLVIDNPFAFLLAVIFDQGIVAERAWAAPYELGRRLGHLDPYRLRDDVAGIAKAVATPPMLQRFINTIPLWVASAARRVVHIYGGDAGLIWGDNPSADELERRLQAFDGIGQKKAAMAVEILERDLKVPIRELQQTDIAYDVHVRRVFLRTGLADRDDRDHMIDQGRRLHPIRPGAIDFPMWIVGRRWCRPGVPSCPECPLFDVCPRLVDRAAYVRGA
jgi:uncharacterized HhH-GPD family protein